MMARKDQSTRQTIILAVIDCIEESGIENITIRQIAEKAGTNIASINYHFRTKDELVDHVLATTSQHMAEDVFAIIENDQLTFRNVLEEACFYLLDGARRFPGITTAHLYRAVVEKDYDADGPSTLRKVFRVLADRAVEEFPEMDAKRIRFLLSQVFASIMFNMLAPNYLKVDRQLQPLDVARCRSLAGLYSDVMFSNL
jgi:AcrR family transcriptional regulator